jgi:hypothetical protein
VAPDLRRRCGVSDLELAPIPAEPKGIKFNDLEGVLADVKSVGWRE